MANNSIDDWDINADNNTDVANVNIAEQCAPSGINNAIRAMMAQLKVWANALYSPSFTAMQSGRGGAKIRVADDASTTGLVEFLKSDGTRYGYVGYAGAVSAGNDINYFNDQGGGHVFNRLVKVGDATHGLAVLVPGDSTLNTGYTAFFTAGGGRLGYVGYIATGGVAPIIYNNETGGDHKFGGAAVIPTTDNAQDIGLSSLRWRVIYCATGTINTSDEREKDWRGALNDAEMAAAKEIAANIGVYQWINEIALKGGDRARLHVGLKAQEVARVFQAHGLDAGRYGLYCYDKWTATDPTPATETMPEVKGTPAGDRYGIRPDELCFFLLAAQAQRISALEQAHG